MVSIIVIIVNIIVNIIVVLINVSIIVNIMVGIIVIIVIIIVNIISSIIIIIVNIIISIIIIIVNIIVVIINLSIIVNIMVAIVIIIIMIIIHATGVSRLRWASSHHGCPAWQRSLFLYLSRNQDHRFNWTYYRSQVFPNFLHWIKAGCKIFKKKGKDKRDLAFPDNSDSQAVPIY